MIHACSCSMFLLVQVLLRLEAPRWIISSTHEHPGIEAMLQSATNCEFKFVHLLLTWIYGQYRNSMTEFRKLGGYQRRYVQIIDAWDTCAPGQSLMGMASTLRRGRANAFVRVLKAQTQTVLRFVNWRCWSLSPSMSFASQRKKIELVNSIEGRLLDIWHAVDQKA